jgi:hypothetical protein
VVTGKTLTKTLPSKIPVLTSPQEIKQPSKPKDESEKKKSKESKKEGKKGDKKEKKDKDKKDKKEKKEKKEKEKEKKLAAHAHDTMGQPTPGDRRNTRHMATTE